MKHIFSMVAVLVAAWNLAFSQESQQAASSKAGGISLGVFAAYNLNFHNANFLELPGAPVFAPRTGSSYEPAAFTGVNSNSLALGVLAMYHLSDEMALSLRLGYAGHDAAFRTRSTYPIGRTDGTATDATSEFTLNTALATISAEPLFSYRIVGGLQVSVGVRASFIVNGSFDQRETLISPSDGGFDATRSRARALQTGSIPGLQTLWLAGVAGLGYDIPVGANLTVAPEAFYSLGITQIVQNVNWSIHTFRAGVSARYRL